MVIFADLALKCNLRPKQRVLLLILYLAPYLERVGKHEGMHMEVPRRKSVNDKASHGCYSRGIRCGRR